MNTLDKTPKTTPLTDRLPRAFSWSMPRKKPPATSIQQLATALDTVFFRIRTEKTTTKMMVVDLAT